jgi:hypothetical protein
LSAIGEEPGKFSQVKASDGLHSIVFSLQELN